CNFEKKVRNCLNQNDKFLAKSNSQKSFFKKSKYKKLASRFREKAHNIEKDMQYKAANYLAKNFRYIFLPKLSTKQVVSGKKYKSPSLARAIYASSQYAFRQKLIMKAREYNSTVILCNEHYTSKTCTNCGNIDENLGGKKLY